MGALSCGKGPSSEEKALIYLLLFRISQKEQSVDVHSAEDLDHFAAQAVCNRQSLLRRQLTYILVEKVILQFKLFDEHFGMENVGLVHIDVNRVIFLKRLVIYIILNRCHIVVDEQFFTVHITRKAAHTIIDGHNIGIKTTDKVVERIK